MEMTSPRTTRETPFSPGNSDPDRVEVRSLTIRIEAENPQAVQKSVTQLSRRSNDKRPDP